MRFPFKFWGRNRTESNEPPDWAWIETHALMSRNAGSLIPSLEPWHSREAEAMTTGSGSDWRTLYRDVLGETDKGKLKNKVDDLEAAIFFRFQENPSPAEGEELSRALESTLTIKIEKLGYPMDSRLLKGRWAK